MMRRWLWPPLRVLLPAVLVLKQPDLGTMLTLCLIFVTLIFAAGLNLRTLLILVLGAMLAAPVGWHYLKPYQRQRVVSFMNPHRLCWGFAYDFPFAYIVAVVTLISRRWGESIGAVFRSRRTAATPGKPKK